MAARTTHTSLIEIEYQSSKGKCFAQIDLSEGGRLTQLTLQNKKVIDSEEEGDYATTFASAILFPFVNRVEDGVYTFKNKTYFLNKNLVNDKHAIHGMVYNKSFVLEHEIVKERFTEVKLSYIENGKVEGFPFDFKIELTYELSDSYLNLMMNVINMDTVEFPFSLGWHPYFLSSDLEQSIISFDAKTLVVTDDSGIPIDFEAKAIPKQIEINNQTFDNCYELNRSTIVFKTPDYEIELDTPNNSKYLQLYIPTHRKSIAIEPMTSPPNCFNNSIGLKTLLPGQEYYANWSVTLKTTKTNLSDKIK